MTKPASPTGRYTLPPAMQNIPIRTETGRRIREAFDAQALGASWRQAYPLGTTPEEAEARVAAFKARHPELVSFFSEVFAGRGARTLSYLAAVEPIPDAPPGPWPSPFPLPDDGTKVEP